MTLYVNLKVLPLLRAYDDDEDDSTNPMSSFLFFLFMYDLLSSSSYCGILVQMTSYVSQDTPSFWELLINISLYPDDLYVSQGTPLHYRWLPWRGLPATT